MIRMLRWRTLAKKTTLKGLAASPGNFHMTLNGLRVSQSVLKMPSKPRTDFYRTLCQC